MTKISFAKFEWFRLAIVWALVALVLLLSPLGAEAQKDTRQLTRENSKNQEKRIALIIGNGSYTDSPLRNPPNDAADMAATLKTLGFEVSLLTNSNQTTMKRAIRSFGEQLRGSDGIGLFYYAGHGVQVKGVNYLIPVGATVNTEEEVEYEGIDVGLVLAQMESAKNKLNIVILDACRNNPFARSFRSADKGLASIDAPSGTLLAYSTAPGSVASDGTGRNGLYTQELLKQMKTSGLSIEDVFKRVRVSVRGLTQDKQTPWESSSLTGDFYFSGSSSAKILPQTKTVNNSPADESIWNAIKDSKDRNSFAEFIKSFPKSKYVPQAQKRLKDLESQSTISNTANPNNQTNNTTKSEQNLIKVYNATFSKIASNDYLFIYIIGIDAAADVKAFLNGVEISSMIKEQGQYGITLKGKNKEFNIKIGQNQTYVIVNGVKSNVFIFKQFE